MNIDKIKQSRLAYRCERIQSVRMIKDVNSDLVSITINVRIVFKSMALSLPNVQEHRRVLKPTDRLYLHYDCANKDCTSDGFDLTYLLIEAITKRQSIQGKLYCVGKEDWKYLNAAGCSCITNLEYKIEPVFV